MNWAEYLSWRNPRIATTMQYLLYDPNPTSGVPEYGGFASGLRFWDGRLKPGYDSYRLPVYLPVTSTRRGRTLEVWGCARPARYGAIDSHAPQRVRIQFRRGSAAPWSTVQTVTITNPRGYFDARVRFPSSGSVRLAWSYPSGDPLLPPSHGEPLWPLAVHSRGVNVTVR
jgi:hypothetical protein